MRQHYRSFAEFYPFYLSEHRNLACRRMHFVGMWCVITLVLAAVATGRFRWLAGVPVVGYGFAWMGHAFFEHNRPTTLTHPVYSLIGDFSMFRDILIGRIRI